MPHSPRALAAFLLSACWPTTVFGEGEQQFYDLGRLALQNGSAIEHCRIGFRTFGHLDPQQSNAVLFPTWFTGRSEDLTAYVGPDKALDPGKYFIILVDALGDGVTSSPSNSEAQPHMRFPQFTIHDMVEAEYRLATGQFGLRHLRAVIGISMGGMQTFDWVVTHPEFMDRAVPIVGSPRLTATDLLLWTGEMHALEESSAWKDGEYTGHPALHAVLDMHAFALTTPEYRAKQTSPTDFPKYLTEAETTKFDWNDWHRQLEAMMAQDIGRSAGGSLEQAARRVKAKLLVITATQDHMVNPAPAIRFSELTGGTLIRLTGDCGHLAPGCEQENYLRQLQAFLAER